MKYYIYQLLLMLPFSVVIILTREVSGLFGFVVGAALVAYGYAFHMLMNKQTKELYEKAYQKFLVELEASRNRNPEPW